MGALITGVGYKCATTSTRSSRQDLGLFDAFRPDDFAALMRLEACTFVPYNLCAFRALPVGLRPLGYISPISQQVDLRPLGSASLSAVCTVVLSGFTLGFGP